MFDWQLGTNLKETAVPQKPKLNNVKSGAYWEIQLSQKVHKYEDTWLYNWNKN